MDDLRAAVNAGDPATRLRVAGLRATRPRTTLLRWLDANPGHHSAETIAQQGGLPKATAYHVLGQLVDAGVVLTAEVGPGRVLYDTETVFHHHFVCSACGSVTDVPCPGDQQPCLDLDVPQAALLDRADVIIRGRCKGCA